MADRYDPNSGTNLDKFDNAGDPSSDTWATLVKHITGYPVPDRSTIFDTLRSDHGGKLFRMDIKERSLSLMVKDSGFLTNTGEDYDIFFFDGNKKKKIMQARIVFEGRVKAGEEIIFAGPGSDNVNDAQVREGNEFTDYNKDKMSTVALARYMNGPRTALLELLKGGTQNARFSNLGVGGSDAVDLSSFNATGDSFDYAAKFFRDHAVVLKDWEDRFGKDDASWKGEAADVFRSLLKKIRENYDAYVETFDSKAGTGDETGTGNTVYSRALSLGRKYLEDAASKLLDAWLAWAKSPYYDPHQVLRYVLDDLAQWVDNNNVAKTDITVTSNRYTSNVSHNPKGGFSHTHPEYGDLTDVANWAKVGDKAVKIWSQGVEEYLSKPAATVQSNLNNHFLELGEDFADNVPKPKSTSTASEEYEKEQLEKEKEEAKKEKEENKKEQDELREEQRKQREEDKKYQEELREEQRKQREEDKKYQDELREEQKKEQDEAKREADELREEQRKQREEDKKYADELREEQKKEQDEAKREAEELRNEQKGEQDEAKREAEELRNEQNQQRDEDKKYADELREEQKKEQEEAKREAEEQAKEVKESLGGLNDPNAITTENLDSLDDLLNQNNAVTTESLGDIGDINGTGNGQGETDLGPVTQSLGGLGGLNGTGGALNTPTGAKTQADGGKLTTDFPDGSSTSFDPDSGLLTTTSPDGAVTTQDLGDGLKVTNPDGSVTSLGDDGKLTTTFPDGTTQTVDPATGQAITTNPDGSTTTTDLGSLTDLNGSLNGDGVLDGPTGTSTQLNNAGELTTDFPDGSSTSFDPDSGLLTSTSPDGAVTTQDLGDGLKVTNPDGSVTSLGDDGKLTTTFPDGTTQSVDPSTGQAVTTDPDGTTTTENLGSLGDLNGQNSQNSLNDLNNSLNDLNDLNDLGDINSDVTTETLGNLGDLNSDGSALETPTGGQVELDDSGDFLTTFDDGGTSTFDPDNGLLTSTDADGNVTTTDLTHGARVANPDGSFTTLDNGQLTTTFPDGSTQVIDPDTGIATVTDPQGNTETVDLHDLNSSANNDRSDILDGLGDLNGIGDLDTTGGGTTSRDVPLSELGLGGGAGGGASGGAYSGGLSGTDSLSSDFQGSGVAPLSDGAGSPLTAATAANAGAGTPGAPGTPGSPGMPMGGGGGGMGAGGEKGNGERVRSVLVDAAEESERRNRRRRSPWNRQEDNDTFLAPSRVNTTGGGGDSPQEETEPGRRVTSSADYLEEDEDVWGTEEGGTPAVIGR
ncbi:phage baseplate assembly protein gpV [Streptomyces sp. V3I8]|uniref:AAWKG family protein n=1 Tax=Streptomyces sp. V3I8 TaxID=3042279 RepID=UPI002784288B|nr:AAWKG family protein [Streptomyces sp. V3I8]MDQ1040437.1 phage baseplate assembly protein gpV [Streptomyces sp. V3I8]